MHTHRWPNISSDFICIYEKIAGHRDSAPGPAGGAHDAPQTPMSDPLRHVPVTLASYDLRHGRSSRIAAPKLWSTYPNVHHLFSRISWCGRMPVIVCSIISTKHCYIACIPFTSALNRPTFEIDKNEMRVVSNVNVNSRHFQHSACL